MLIDTILIEYEDTLINRASEIRSDNFYGKGPSYANQTIALKCIRYAIEEILGWDADIAINKFDKYILEKMKLTKIASYIDYPDEVADLDPKYILSLLYPQKVHMDHESMVIDVFQRVLKKIDKQFPRDYFSGGIGFNRFCHCVKYIIENILAFDNIPDIYEFFSTSKGRDILLEHRLRTPAYQYDIDLYEVIYTITRDYDDGDLWYSYYCFQREMMQEAPEYTDYLKKTDIPEPEEPEDDLEENQESDVPMEDLSNVSEDDLKSRLAEMGIDVPENLEDENSDKHSFIMDHMGNYDI